jgi:hypothetical protein
VAIRLFVFRKLACGGIKYRVTARWAVVLTFAIHWHIFVLDCVFVVGTFLAIALAGNYILRMRVGVFLNVTNSALVWPADIQVKLPSQSSQVSLRI